MRQSNNNPFLIPLALLLSILCMLPGRCDAVNGFEMYGEVRRNTVGNHAIRFLVLCARFAQGRIPAELIGAGVQIVSRYWQGFFVHFVTGFPRVATYLLPNANQSTCKTTPTKVLHGALRQGMIHVKASDAFGIKNKNTVGRILNDMLSCIALAHPDVPDLARETIMTIPSYRSHTAGYLNNTNYAKANIPVFYVGDTLCKSVTAVRNVVGMRRETVTGVCHALMQRFFQQESNDPIQSTEEEMQMLNGQIIVCRIQRRRGGRRARRARG